MLSHNSIVFPITDWLIDQALGDPEMDRMFCDLCDRIYAAGIPIKRARVTWPTLHPLFSAETVLWTQGEGAELEQFPHREDKSEEWLKSPMRFMVENEIEFFRRRLTGPNKILDFEILESFRDRGLTDYLAMTGGFGNHNNSDLKGIMASWATERSNGFTDEDINALRLIMRNLSVACKTIIQDRIASFVTDTYLGKWAGKNVLDGLIKRGDGRDTKAIIWYSDMRNSTMLAESMPAEEYFPMLSGFFECTAGPVMDAGGEVLDFVGDGVLAIFPFECEESLKKAGSQAMQALDESCAALKQNDAKRKEQGLTGYGYGIGMEVGDVMFGNIGIPQRLTFSAIGHSVNQVARIESMTKKLQQPILAGGRFAALAPERWSSMGKFKLDGVLDKKELFRLV